MQIDVNKVRTNYKLIYDWARNDSPRILAPYLDYLNESMKSPTLARIHARDVVNIAKKNSLHEAIRLANVDGLGVLVSEFYRNISAKSNLNALKVLKSFADYENQYQKLYPKSGTLRNKLIQLERINLSQVIPKSKLKLKEKLFLKLPESGLVDFFLPIIKK